MNGYYNFVLYIVNDDSDEAKDCQKYMKMINEYGHAYTSLDVTPMKEYYRLQMIEKHGIERFPAIQCEEDFLRKTETLEGFLQMLKMSPCYLEQEENVCKKLIKKTDDEN